jgi:hypothetical protein
MIRTILTIAAAVIALQCSGPAQAALDWQKVEQVLGRKAATMPGDVHRFGFPRSDLKVTLDGVTIKPALALGSWLAFKETTDGAVVMGDLVLTSDEVNPVMQRIAEGGIEITALHNHLLRSMPATMYMHIEGHGDPSKLAETLYGALGLSKTPLEALPAAAAPESIDLDTAALEKILDSKGKASGGVYQFSIPRAEPIKAGDMDVPPAMGTAIAINFEPTGGGKAAIAGDFALAAAEVNPVLRTLRANGIEVTAIHNHMLNEEPRLFFMHFWANDDATKLAKGLRAALDQVNTAKM